MHNSTPHLLPGRDELVVGLALEAFLLLRREEGDNTAHGLCSRDQLHIQALEGVVEGIQSLGRGKRRGGGGQYWGKQMSCVQLLH